MLRSVILHVAAAAAIAASAAGENVVSLTDATFDNIIKNSNNKPWLVEFFAPWCGHCKKLLPKFEEAAKQVAIGSSALIKIGKVDCDAEPKLKSRFGVEGFPQIMYFQNGATDTGSAREYRGPRTAEAVVRFAKRMARPAVADLTSTQDLHAWAAAGGADAASFVYVDVGGSSSEYSSAFQKVAASLHDSLTFGSMRTAGVQLSPVLAKQLGLDGSAWPAASFVARIEPGLASSERVTWSEILDAAGSPSAMAAAVAANTKAKRGTRSDPLYGLKPNSPEFVLGSWVLHWRFPQLPALGPDNFPYIANNEEGRFVAVAVVDEKDAFPADGDASRPNAAFLRALRNLADTSRSSLPASVRDKFLFGWIDSEKHSSFTQQFGLSPTTDTPRLLVIDAPRKAYWYDATVNEEDEMDTYLKEIVEGRAPMQRQGMMAMPQKLVNALGLYGASAVGVLVSLLLCWVIYKLVIAEAMGWNSQEREAETVRSVQDKQKRPVPKKVVQPQYEEESSDEDLPRLPVKPAKREAPVPERAAAVPTARVSAHVPQVEAEEKEEGEEASIKPKRIVSTADPFTGGMLAADVPSAPPAPASVQKSPAPAAARPTAPISVPASAAVPLPGQDTAPSTTTAIPKEGAKEKVTPKPSNASPARVEHSRAAAPVAVPQAAAAVATAEASKDDEQAARKEVHPVSHSSAAALPKDSPPASSQAEDSVSSIAASIPAQSATEEADTTGVEPANTPSRQQPEASPPVHQNALPDSSTDAPPAAEEAAGSAPIRSAGKGAAAVRRRRAD